MAHLENERRSSEILLRLVERHKLFHVKTLRYNDLRGLLDWLGVKPDQFFIYHGEDTICVLTRYIRTFERTDIGVMAINDDECSVAINQKKYLVVYDKHHRVESRKYDSIILFLVIECNRQVPSCRETTEIMKATRDLIARMKLRENIFPTFASRPRQRMEPLPHQTCPVMDGYLPSSYDTITPRASLNSEDIFGLKYENVEVEPKGQVNPWIVYTNIPQNVNPTLNLEQFITSQDQVLGRGGFGVTVKISDKLAAKTNMFPDILNWSRPFIDDQFNRYAHIASQAEEVMIGVSIKHPNILRTFGGYWCDIPDYQLGGRAVVFMERALFSLHEFMHHLNRDVSVVPAVELDTLRGLEYLRSRCIQHRDFTCRNVLVCHQPDRRPLPFAFKISDFGTACNFSTPDLQRGNRVNMAPEVLWCLNSATGSDVFSWYCVMWELHKGSPLIAYKGSGVHSGYCVKTYARNLSNLVGVYSPNTYARGAFETGHMKSFEARTLYEEHKDARPGVEDIHRSLQELGAGITDKTFIRMGLLCITLFPQERWSPSQLLSTIRYQYLANDITSANSPCQAIPACIRLGDFRTTDIIVSKDCVPDDLGLIMRLQTNAKSPIVAIEPKAKVFYGVDLLRLAPGYIQPYQWYLKKAQALEDLYKLKYKRRAEDAQREHNQQRGAKLTRLNADDPGEGPSHSVQRGRITVTNQDVQMPVEPQPLTPVHAVEGQGLRDHARKKADCEPATHVGSKLLHNSESKRECDETQGASEVARASSAADDPMLHASTDELLWSGDQGVEEEMGSQHSSSGNPGPRPANPEGIVFARKVEGEMDTSVVILKSQREDEIVSFENKVVLLSHSMTSEHPSVFTGPRDMLYKCSRSNGLYIYQYAQFFECKKVLDWSPSDSPHSAHAFLLQVFLTLQVAAKANVLPVRMTCRYLVTGNGAVMIDIVTYLSSNFTKPSDSLFGDHCKRLNQVCSELTARHLPESNLHKWFCALSSGARSTNVLDKAIEWLRKVHPHASERTNPTLLSLVDNCFTFKAYLSEIPNWVTRAGCDLRERNECNGKLLVYGNPKVFTGNQSAENVGSTKLEALVRNIVMRLKVKLFGSSLVTVTALDCTQGLTKVTLDNATLASVPSIAKLDRLRLNTDDQGCCYTHDAVSSTRSKWAPVIMFTKLMRRGPVQELDVKQYRMVILIAALRPRGEVHSLKELFRGVSLLSTMEY